MEAIVLAEKVNARPAGPNSWLAVCPAHRDRRPSLSIKQGKQAVLLRCWSNGCSVEAICRAWGISLRSLSSYADLSNREQDHLARQRHARDRLEREAWEADRKERWKLWELGEVLNQREDARDKHPDSPIIAGAYHAALEAYRRKECELYPDREDGPMRQPGDLFLPPDWIAGVLKSIGKNFNQNDENPAPTESSVTTKIKG